MGWIGAIGRHHAAITLPPGDPGEPSIYGPTGGATAIRTAASPLAVVHPGGSPTVVNPGDNWATKITTAGTNGTLWVTKGTHVRTSVATPLAGQTFVLESSAGINRDSSNSAVVDGQDANFAAFLSAAVSNVTIRGGVWMRQGNSAGDADGAQGAIRATGASTGWTVEDAVVKDNRNIGLKFNDGTNHTVRRCYANNNGRYGVSVADGGVLEKTRISNNNSRNLDPGFDAGGTKLGTGTGNNMIIRQNYAHNNNGSGIWIDISGGGHTIEDNVCEDNAYWGIFYEFARGNTTITRNYLDGNGELAPSSFGAANTLGSWFNAVQLLVSCSDGTLTPGDIVVSFNDIYALERAMGMINHDSHTTDSRRVKFRNNRVWLQNTGTFGGEQGQVGGQDTQVTKTLFTDTTNEFSGNEYHVASSTHTYWKWGGAGAGANINWTAWLALGLNRGNAPDTRVIM